MSTSRQTVAITGAFGTLGLAVARLLAAAGVQPVLIDFAPAPAETEREFIDQLLLGGVNLTDTAETARTFEAIRARFGALDGLVNICGSFKCEMLNGGSIDNWIPLYVKDLHTAACASRAALPLILSRGRGGIVNIDAANISKAGAGLEAYAASKAGVVRLTKRLAEELKNCPVTVNALLPTILDTPQNLLDLPDADFTKWVAPNAIAGVIQFLLSSAASAVTGALIPVTNRC